MEHGEDNLKLAYIIGCALGDGNLSSPNGRVTRLRITCDASYPRIAQEIISSLQILFPNNKIGLVNRNDDKCFDISLYSKKLDTLMPWSVGNGSKMSQGARVPSWILKDSIFMKECLRGLIQTDGCIYMDRGYKMINFVNNSKPLAEDVCSILLQLGFKPRFNTLDLKYGATKYTVKVARKLEVARLIQDLGLYKA